MDQMLGRAAARSEAAMRGCATHRQKIPMAQVLLIFLSCSKTLWSSQQPCGHGMGFMSGLSISPRDYLMIRPVVPLDLIAGSGSRG